MTQLRSGAKIESTIQGWYLKQRKLNIGTQDRLAATGELVEVLVQGRCMQQHFVVHETKIREACHGKTLRAVRAIFSDGRVYFPPKDHDGKKEKEG
jgi:hypothetical protein